MASLALRAELGSALCLIVLSQNSAVSHLEEMAMSLEPVFSSPFPVYKDLFCRGK